MNAPELAFAALHVLAMVVVPFVLTGLINRIKALWSGRRGAPILQPAFDALRLMRKRSRYSRTTTPLFRVAPWVFLSTAAATALVTPLLGAPPPVSFSFDLVWLAYLWSLGRVLMMLAALDTGSSFEGMGAAREATFASLLEPAFFLVVGALCLVSHTHTLHRALAPDLTAGPEVVLVWSASVVALLIVLQVETSRMPVDDPTTHLELTMVHEVMVLDHSGPDLAAVQAGAAVKLYVGCAMIASLLNPLSGDRGVASAAVSVALSAAVAIFLATVESLVARLKLRRVPQYIVIAVVAGAVALLATSWRAGGGP